MMWMMRKTWTVLRLLRLPQQAMTTLLPATQLRLLRLHQRVTRTPRTRSLPWPSRVATRQRCRWLWWQ